MKTLLTLLMAASFVGSLYAPVADAARVGGGRSTGIQRSVTPPPKSTPAQAAPAAAPAAPAAAAQAGGNRWMGPLAGLAAGLGLGWLLSQGGFGGAMGGVILALLGAMVLFALLRIYSRRNEIKNAGAQPMQYAGIGPQGIPAPQ
ncbi:MAG: Tim44 domain-containing protein, partial [Burkholderiales bacterium]